MPIVNAKQTCYGFTTFIKL